MALPRAAASQAAVRRPRRARAACLGLLAASLAAVGSSRGGAFVNSALPSTGLQPRSATGALLGARQPQVAAWAGGAEAGEARERFLQVLDEAKGDWRSDSVTEELEKVEAANPTSEPALTGEFLDADWLQVSNPDYNYGKDREPGSTEYTLGQLSFGMYEPKDMKMRIDKTTQLVAPVEGGNGTRSWDIKLHLTCVDEAYPSFKAELTTFGEISPGEDKEGKNNRLAVTFNKGTLKPMPGADKETLDAWLDVFGSAISGRKRTLGSMLKNGLLRLMMGLRLPAGIEDDGTVMFEMKKPPHGYTDILYIDEKMRVTRGNRGSIVVATRK